LYIGNSPVCPNQVGCFLLKGRKMKQENERPLYATLLYSVRNNLGISIAEYFYLDMVYHLSKNPKGYCYKSLEAIGKDMGISSIAVMKMRNRLKEKELVVVKRGNKVATSEKYNKVIRSGDSSEKTYNKVSKTYNKVIVDTKQSYNKNNNEINKDNRDLKGKGYKAFQQAKLKLLENK